MRAKPLAWRGTFLASGKLGIASTSSPLWPCTPPTRCISAPRCRHSASIAKSEAARMCFEDARRRQFRAANDPGSFVTRLRCAQLALHVRRARRTRTLHCSPLPTVTDGDVSWYTKHRTQHGSHHAKHSISRASWLSPCLSRLRPGSWV